MSDPIPPLAFRWDGESMVPLSAIAADRNYTIGEIYRLVPYEERSQRSHAHYFACIQEAWQNLPERLAQRFPTPEHLRKYALIWAGHRDERSIVARSKTEAYGIAQFVRPVDPFSVVVMHEATVTVMTAKSQSTRAMGAKEFQRSKDAVLDFLAGMIGVEADDLRREAGRAA